VEVTQGYSSYHGRGGTAYDLMHTSDSARVYPESPHGFTSFPTAMAAAAVRGIESWLADRLLRE
jgi:hypothetical protein